MPHAQFRNDYRHLGSLRLRLPSVPIIALTATAVPRVQSDIQTSLRMRSPMVLAQSAFRDNLAIRCMRCARVQPVHSLANSLESRVNFASS